MGVGAAKYGTPLPKTDHPPPRDQNVRCKNIVLPQTSFAGGNDYSRYQELKILHKVGFELENDFLVRLQQTTSPLFYTHVDIFSF